MAKKRVLIVQSHIRSSGGGHAVAAWAIQALREACDVSLATLRPVDWGEVNRSFGTDLKDGDCTLQLAPEFYRRVLSWLPGANALLEISLVARFAQDLDKRHGYEVVFSTQNEIDFHRRGLQYIHYPSFYLPRPEIELRRFHRIPGLLSFYRAVCTRLHRATTESLRRNVSLVNSKFVAGKIREVYGTDSIIVYPPAPGEFPLVPWAQRSNAFVAVGRMNRCKRWEMAVSIIDELRRRGHDLSLTVIGQHDSGDYEARLTALAATRPWFRLLHELTRDELVLEIALHRYGIHTMEEEHFGMAPAEIQRAGCITFVHNSGGPPEIVGNEPQLCFDTVEEAAGKIERVLTDSAIRERLQHHVAAQRDRFTVEQFCTSIRRVVEDLDGRAGAIDLL